MYPIRYFLWPLAIIAIHLINAYTPAVVTQLYHRNDLGFLNWIANASNTQPLDHYIGMAEDKFAGPLCSVLTGFLLISVISFSSKYSSKLLGTAIVITLLLAKTEVLFFPPYGDPVSGPWTEALWLLKNNFDYGGLIAQAPYASGGPKSYVFSIYPGFLALLMRMIPSTPVFLFIIHLSFFILAAGACVMFRTILLKNFDETTANLGSALLISLPLFQSMSETLSMDFPCMFFALATVYFLVLDKTGLACLFSILSLCTKVPGIIACLTVIIGCLIRFFGPVQKKNVRLLIWSAIVLVFSVLQIYLRSRFVNTVSTSHNAVGFLISLPYAYYQSTWSYWIFGACLAVFVVFCFIESKKKNHTQIFIFRHFCTCMMFTAALSWFLLFLNFSVMAHRYKILLTPFLLYCAIFAIHVIIKNKKLVKILLLTGIFIANVGSYGLLYGNRIGNKEYAYGELERSLEYRNDLKLYKKLAQRMETEYKDFTIGAPFLIAECLASPKLGYTSQHLDIMIYGISVTHSGIRNFGGLNNLNLARTIWVGLDSSQQNGILYPIDEKDIVIEEIRWGDRKASLFLGGLAIEKLWRQTLERIIEHFTLIQSSQGPG